MKCPFSRFMLEPSASEQSVGTCSGNESSQGTKGKPVSISSSTNGYYRWVFLILWGLITLLLVLDRFFTNFWPRQSFSGAPCNSQCGGDFFCGPTGESGPPGCLRQGPWSAKTFDFIARASARIIISTTNLMFLTVSHSTWNFLSERKWLRPYLHDWREDNLWIHSIGGIFMATWTMLHMWTLFLPSMFHGFKNVHVPGAFAWPAQITLNGPQIDVGTAQARWGSDDIWRIVWLTVILCILLPYSRSRWALRKNFSLAMWIHVGCAAGFFIDSFRRKTHPHVWILNTPFVAWYLVDRLASVTWYRSERNKHARKIVLDENYMILLWKQEKFPKGICDVYWLKEHLSSKWRVMEWSHPFTVASAHYIQLQDGTSKAREPLHQSMIEIPVTVDTSWDGHRFPVKSSSCNHCHSENSRIFRLDTADFLQKRVSLKENLAGPRTWDCMAIMRVHRQEKKESETSVPKWIRCLRAHMCGLCFRSPETETIAKRDVEDNVGGSIAMNIYGPYRSSYRRLTGLPNLPPLVIIGTGAGAGLVLDTMAHIREHNINLQYPIKIYYSAASLPLLQFVTNNLLAAKIPALTVQTALTKNRELEFEDTEIDEKKRQLQLGRFRVSDIISSAILFPKTEVYFCGATAINEKLKKECSRRRIKYVGSSIC